ncbi:MAG: GNAT family N-acetyltransferase [Pseudomonadales bacterium]
MTIEIRPYQPSDIFQLYQICLQTGASGEDATGTIDPELLGHIYAAPYVFADPSLCFVITRGGWPSGYILGTSDSLGFQQWTEKHWWPQIRAKYDPGNDRLTARESALVRMIHQPVKGQPDYYHAYPAHLHIDLVKSVQSSGYGSKLMLRFLDALRTRRVPGVHLGVGKANQRAIDWYPKFGFEPIVETESEIVFGLQL